MFRLTPTPATVNEIPNITNYKISRFSPPLYLGLTDAPSNVAACQAWFQNDAGPPTGLTPCPPTMDQAYHDPRFKADVAYFVLAFFRLGAEVIFRQRSVKVTGYGPSATTAPGQVCNYANGSIVLGPKAGGTADMVAPLALSEAAHFVADGFPWLYCCYYSGDDASCRNFYVKRPSDPGTNYVAPPLCAAGGDPHIVTLDKTTYTFNAVGEFRMVQSTNFSMQGRMERYRNASIFTSFVMRQAASADQNQTTVQISVHLAGFYIHIDNVILSLDPAQTLPINMQYNGFSLSFESASQITVDFTKGFTFVFTTAGNNTSLNVMGMAHTSLYGQVNGLFGYFDGQPGNDLKAPNGTTIATNSSIQVIHSEFGLQWRVGSTDSLFTYVPGKSYSDYQDASFVPSFASVNPATLSAEGQAICGTSPECAFDFQNTGDPQFASDTSTFMTSYHTSLSSLTTNVPHCTALTNPANGYYKATNFAVGSKVTFYCNRSYKMIGFSQLTCQGNPPAWNHNKPTCQYCCLDCDVCILWASLWYFLHLPPPLTPPPLPPCCPVSFY